MSKTLVFSASAGRAFAKLAPDLQERFYKALFAYGDHGVGDVKRMVGTPTTRMRIGDYRIIMDEQPNALEILSIGNRREVYR